METNIKRFEVGIYRTVVHYRTAFVDAESSDEAHDKASRHIDLEGEAEHLKWKYQRTEHRIIYVHRDLRGRPAAGSCNDGASVDAGGDDSRPGVAGNSDQLPGFA
jgi:hypothetical protein